MARPGAPAAQSPAGPPPAGPRRGGLLARIGGSRNGAILAAGATVAVVALLSVLRKGKSAAPTPVQAGDGLDSGPYDMWDQWEQQYEDLAGRVTTLENPPVPTPTPRPVPPVHIPLPPIVRAPPGVKPLPKPPVRVSPTPTPRPVPKASRLGGMVKRTST